MYIVSEAWFSLPEDVQPWQSSHTLLSDSFLYRVHRDVVIIASNCQMRLWIEKEKKKKYIIYTKRGRDVLILIGLSWQPTFVLSTNFPPPTKGKRLIGFGIKGIFCFTGLSATTAEAIPPSLSQCEQRVNLMPTLQRREIQKAGKQQAVFLKWGKKIASNFSKVWGKGGILKTNRYTIKPWSRLIYRKLPLGVCSNFIHLTK